MELDLLVPKGCPPDPPAGSGESLAQAMPDQRQMSQQLSSSVYRRQMSQQLNSSVYRTRARTLVPGSAGMIILDIGVPSSLFGVSAFTQPEKESRRGGNRAAHRYGELQWLRAHREELRPLVGQWVVIEGEGIAASGPDPVEVVREARRKGIKVPFVRRIEPDRPQGTADIGL